MSYRENKRGRVRRRKKGGREEKREEGKEGDRDRRDGF